MSVASRTEVGVERLDVSAYEIPTDQPESDGTLEWDSTTIVVVETHGGGETGLGYTYGPAAAGKLVEEKLASEVEGADALAPAESWERLGRALRNVGRPGIGAMAIEAVDTALWDLKARLLGVALVDVLPRAHDAVPLYGSGGFCSYSLERLSDQLGGWAADGLPAVKMKISREPERDPERLDAARQTIGDETELFVDANGAFSAKQALDWAHRLRREWGVSWFEEPVSSADFEGLRLVREQGPGGLEIAAGEYAYVLADFRNLVGCVDCLLADVTRCGGITGLLQARRQFLLPAFAAAFLGATSIKPGRFNAIGTGIAVYFLATGVNGLQLLGAENYVQQLFYGAALVAAVVLSRQLRRR